MFVVLLELSGYPLHASSIAGALAAGKPSVADLRYHGARLQAKEPLSNPVEPRRGDRSAAWQRTADGAETCQLRACEMAGFNPRYRVLPLRM